MVIQQRPDNGSWPLSTVKAGQIVRLVRIEAGRGLSGRLASMGLIPDVEIHVINNGHPGPLVVSLKGGKVMLGHGMAQRIFVK